MEGNRFHEWGGSAGTFYLVVYRKLDGSAPVVLGARRGQLTLQERTH